MSAIAQRRPTPRGKRATLADVARAAAVSTASASRALTRPEAVSDALRLKVSEAATALGYIPNSAARALVRRRSGLIGVLTGNLERPGMTAALAALEERFSDAGWAALLASGSTSSASLANARALVGLGVEGLVFLGVSVPANLGAVAGMAGLPSVSSERPDDTGFSAGAGLDLGHALKLVGDYLAQLGHSHLVVLTEADSTFGDLVRPGNGSAIATLQRVTLGEEPIAESLLRCLALHDSPTAAICSSDAVALALMHACASHGIDIPRRFSVVGFGDTPLARCTAPTLTSVRIAARSAGLAAADYLLALLDGGVPNHAELPIKLMVRGSTGPAR
jgi:DNA-binding LacI/PurR family transcriptional regulator